MILTCQFCRTSFSLLDALATPSLCAESALPAQHRTPVERLAQSLRVSGLTSIDVLDLQTGQSSRWAL